MRPRSARRAAEWSLLLGHADADIDTDLGRRWWSAPIAGKPGDSRLPHHDRLGHGCPTAVPFAAVGSLLGPPQKSGDNGETADLVQMTQLSGEMGSFRADHRRRSRRDDRSRIAQRRLPRPRYRQKTLAEVAEQRPASRRSAWFRVGFERPDRSDGLEHGGWRVAVEGEDRPPAGRGIVVSDSLYLPLRSGEVRRLRWTTAHARFVVPRESPLVLGNLSMYRGLLVSHGPLGLTAFEQEEAVRRDIARRRAQDPMDIGAALADARGRGPQTRTGPRP